jgi:hypothetical protein
LNVGEDGDQNNGGSTHNMNTTTEGAICVQTSDERGTNYYQPSPVVMTAFEPWISLKDTEHSELTSSLDSIATGNTQQQQLLTPSMHLSVSTDVNVLYCQYRVVISLDVTPSMVVSNLLSGELLYDRLLYVVRTILANITQPITKGNFQVYLESESE